LSPNRADLPRPDLPFELALRLRGAPFPFALGATQAPGIVMPFMQAGAPFFTARPSRRTKAYDLAIDRARGRARREIAAFLGGLLILFNVLAAGVVGASARGASPMLGDISSDRIVICTGAGMIVVDHSGKPVEDKGGGSGKTLCPFCLPLMQGHANAPDPGATAPAPVHSVVVLSRADQIARPEAKCLSSAAQPRAPPLL
jgi:hypothetical protein